MAMTIKQAKQITGGGLTKNTKMPCRNYPLPAAECNVGSKLRKVPGSVCASCYACKGFYTLYKDVAKGQYNRLNAIKYPQWVKAMTVLIDRYSPEYFRFHDSGDIQSKRHLVKIVEIAKRLPNTKIWVPTKEYKLVHWYLKHRAFPENLIVRISSPMINQRPVQIQSVNTCTVNYNTGKSTKHNFQCIAYNQGGKCGKCRACWNKNIKNVNYPLH